MERQPVVTLRLMFVLLTVSSARAEGVSYTATHPIPGHANYAQSAPEHSSRYAQPAIKHMVRHTQHALDHYAQPAPEHQALYAQTAPEHQAHYVQAVPDQQAHYVQAAPDHQAHYAQTAPDHQAHYVQTAPEHEARYAQTAPESKVHYGHSNPGPLVHYIPTAPVSVNHYASLNSGPMAHYVQPAPEPAAHYAQPEGYAPAAPVSHYHYTQSSSLAKSLQPAPVAPYVQPAKHDVQPKYLQSQNYGYAKPMRVAQYARKNPEEKYPSAPAKYYYAYDVQDTMTGDIKSQQESREGDVVHGSYSVVDPDGTRRTVEYTADPQHGFNAVIHREGPKEEAKGFAPASRQSYAHPVPATHLYAKSAPVLVQVPPAYAPVSAPAPAHPLYAHESQYSPKSNAAYSASYVSQSVPAHHE